MATATRRKLTRGGGLDLLTEVAGSDQMDKSATILDQVLAPAPANNGNGALGAANVLANAHANARRLSLRIQPQPEQFPFVDADIKLHVFLVDKKDSIKTASVVPLGVEALYHDGTRVPDQAKLFEVDPRTPAVVQATGDASFNVRFKQVSMAHENKRFKLRVFALPPEGQLGPIDAAFTNEMTVIRHRIKIIEHPPSVWYKDEGGRDKCIALNAVLVDHRGEPVAGREVPLKLSLVYDSERNEVKNQQILKVSNDTLCSIQRDGKVNLKVRIDEVSKNHQKQAFCIRVAPDVSYSPAHSDISPDISKPVVVRSKRNRPKSGKPATEQPPAKRRNLGVPVAASVASTPQSQNLLLSVPSSHTIPAVSSSGAAVQLQPIVSFKDEDFGSLPSGSLLNSTQSTLDSMASLTALLSSTSSSASSSLPTPTAGEMSRSFSSVGGDDAKGSDSTRSFTQGVHSLISWSQYVVRELAALEWQHVGFEINEHDGSLVLQKPIYRCPGCWTSKYVVRHATHHPACMIKNTLQTYEKSIKGTLQGLIALINARSSAGNQSQQRTTQQAQADAPQSRSQESEAKTNKDHHITFDLLQVGDVEQLDDTFKQPGLNFAISGLEAPLPVRGITSMTEGAGAGAMQHDFLSLNFLEPSAADETQVFGMLVMNTPLGFPAFNSDGELLGFYERDRTNPNSGLLPLVPLSSVDQSRVDVNVLRQLFAEHRQNKTQSVVTKATAVTLELMKEQLLLMTFLQQANTGTANGQQDYLS